MIYLVCHGESTFEVEQRLRCKQIGGDLTPTGTTQAEHAAAWLADKQISHIYHSPFVVAQQTSQIIGEKLRVKTTADPNLAAVDCGELAGRDDNYSWGIWRQVWQQWQQHTWDARYTGGESLQEAFDRFRQPLQRARDHSNTVLITHSDIMHAVVPLMCVNYAALKFIDILTNGGIVVLEPYDHLRYACNAWNIVEHLP